MDHPTQRLDRDTPEVPDFALSEDAATEFDHPTQRLDAEAADAATEPQPGTLDSCNLCGGERVWTEVRAGEQRLGARPQAVHFAHQTGRSLLLGTQFTIALCVAQVCVSCGAAQLYAHAPQRLLGES